MVWLRQRNEVNEKVLPENKLYALTNMRGSFVWLLSIQLLDLDFLLKQNVLDLVQVWLQASVNQISWVFILVGLSEFIVENILELVFQVSPVVLNILNFDI